MNKTLRWLPAIVAPVVIIAGVVAAPAVASASSTAASPKTAAQVLALIAKSKDAAYSGRVQQSSDLGLPSLPSTGTGSSSDSTSSSITSTLELLTGSHTARVYVDGSTKERVQVLDTLAESDVIRNGSNVWTYDSKKNAVTHLTASTGASASKHAPATMTPSSLAAKFVAAITPTTNVSTPKTVSFDGQSAYKIVLTPKTSATTVKSVTILVDAAHGLPLSVSVAARGQSTPAISVAYSEINFATPSASLFNFTPPAGAKVTTKTLRGHGDRHSHAGGAHTHHMTPPTAEKAGVAKPKVTRTGWASIVELPAGSGSSALTAATGSNAKLLNELTTVVTGGRALETSLVNVLLTNDGRVFAGAVPVSSLEAAASAGS